jgi:hypothetical protein
MPVIIKTTLRPTEHDITVVKLLHDLLALIYRGESEREVRGNYPHEYVGYKRVLSYYNMWPSERPPKMSELFKHIVDKWYSEGLSTYEIDMLTNAIREMGG